MNKSTLKTSDFNNSKPKNSNTQLNTPSLFNLSDFNKKKVEVRFSEPDTSSDGGILLLREVDKQIGLIDNLTACITDNRHQSYIRHSINSMLSQRIMQIASGNEDANDCDFLKNDEAYKLCANSLDLLSSQPTMSRLENSLSNRDLYKIAEALLNSFITSYKTPPEFIIIDADDTNSTTYGQQELNFYNHYYGDYCYMPLHIYEGVSGKLMSTILKPGRRSKTVDVFAILNRIIRRLKAEWPQTMIILRGDGHFCSKELMTYSSETPKVEFITGLTGNNVLNTKCKITKESAEREYNQYDKPVKRYHSFMYKANSWSREERVVVKVEVNRKGTNIRFIVSSFQTVRAKVLYEEGYCARGSAELRIKDHKTYLNSDRMSCNSFKANQFRLFLHSAAYILIHTLQKEALKGTRFYNATMKTIQLKIIKIATRIKVLKTKIQIELPENYHSKRIFENCITHFQINST